MSIQIEPIDADQLPELVQLNNAAVPAVNEQNCADLAELLSISTWARQLRSAEELAGFLLALRPGSDYQSPNYQWFCAQHEDFLYVDRVVIAAQHRGAGLGLRLYRQLAQQALHARVPVTCEVNLQPPNPGSLRFHQRLGFEQLARQHTDGGAKEVALLLCPLSALARLAQT